MTGQTLTTFPDLHILAEKMGVTLAHHDNGVKGMYNHRTRTISTRRGMSVAQYKSTLAHELAHAYYHDDCTPHSIFGRKQERRADQWAANLLINPDNYLTHFAWHEGNLEAIAEDLEITEHLLKTWVGQQGGERI